MNWLKNNWFKVVVVALLISISSQLLFYFSYQKPEIEKLINRKPLDKIFGVDPVEFNTRLATDLEQRIIALENNKTVAFSDPTIIDLESRINSLEDKIFELELIVKRINSVQELIINTY